MSDTYTPVAPSSAQAQLDLSQSAYGAKPPQPETTVSPQQIISGSEEQARLITEKGTKEAQAKELSTQKIKEIQGRYEPELERMSRQPVEFKPSQETQGELVALFGMIGALGAFSGSGGYTSALNAMNAMGGMLKGYNQGRKDLFEREKAIFDKNMQENKVRYDRIKDAFDRAIKLAPYNLDQAQTKLQSDLIALDAKILAQQVKNEGINKANTIAAQLATRQEQAQYRSQMLALQISRATQGRTAALVQTFEDQVAISVNEAAAQINNLAKLPFATTGIFQGENTKGLFYAPLGVLANTLTKESTQQLKNNVQGLGYELAKILGGGRVVPVTTQKEFADRFAVKEGDKPFTVLQKLANMRQSFERAVEVKLNSPLTSEQMKPIYQRALTDIQSVIPFTVSDVLDAQQEAAKKKGKTIKTFADFMLEKMGGSAQPSTTTQALPAAAPAAAPPVTTEQGFTGRTATGPGGQKLRETVDGKWVP